MTTINEKIKLVDHNNLQHRTQETELLNKINCSEFINWLNQNKYDKDKIHQLLENKHPTSLEQSDFNNLLRKAKKELKIGICECILYIDELLFIRMKRIVNLLDDETKCILKRELLERYKVGRLNKSMRKFALKYD